MKLPPLLEREEIKRRLQLVFAEGYPDRNPLIRDLAAATVFTFLYIGAVEGSGRALAPRHIVRMTDGQARRKTPDERVAYWMASRTRAAPVLAGERRWYADNTREPIRDETIRGLRQAGAVGELALETTSSTPRYFLASSFAALFVPQLAGSALLVAIEDWRGKYIDVRARRRMELVRRSAPATAGRTMVTLPTGEVRSLGIGRSALLTKAVVERFAPRFLTTPVVVWISESGQKVYDRDEALTEALGLEIDIGRLLPDVILADVGIDPEFFVFIEVVVTDGPVTAARQQELCQLAVRAGYDPDQVLTGTAYFDRSAASLKRNLSTLATGSLVWCASEEDTLIAIGSAEPVTARLADMLRRRVGS